MKLPAIILFWLKDFSINVHYHAYLNMFSKDMYVLDQKDWLQLKISYMRNDFISCFDDFALISSFSNAFITTKKNNLALCYLKFSAEKVRQRRFD